MRKSGLFRWMGWGLVPACLVLYGCSKDTDEVRLDFSRTEQNTVAAVEDSSRLKVAVSAMTSPQETLSAYSDLIHYLGDQLGREIRFQQRRTYREVNDLLIKNELDLAFICSGAYVEEDMRGKVELLVMPQIQGETTYRSYLIVSADAPDTSILDLKGKRFAYTDPLSFTGFVYPNYLVAKLGFSAKDFFQQTFFTHAHDKSIQAVARGMVDGACVDGLIYDFLLKSNPHKVSGVKVILESEPFGIPPVVVPVGLNSEVKRNLRRILLSMHEDSAGVRILNDLMIDRFVPPSDEAYNSIRDIFSELYNSE